MLGMVFTEFSELVEKTFGDEVLDDIIDMAELSNDGAFTAVGQYEHTDMLKLVAALSEKTGTSVQDLVKVFGQHLFGQFVVKYPEFFTDVSDSLTFLSRIEDHIHVEVKKLYPNANLPTFQHERLDEGTLKLVYSSSRPFSTLAEGLIYGCAAYFDERLEITREEIDVTDGFSTDFLIKRI